jgi:hypothetical protein
MGINQVPAAVGKTRYALTLTSGTSWTVPDGCFYVNVTLQGGGGAGMNVTTTTVYWSGVGRPGKRVSSTLATTPAASITYAIGAGGTATTSTGGTGGTTSFTGATSATGGTGGTNTGAVGTANSGFDNGGGSGWNAAGGTGNGGAGMIEVEYWV